MNRHVGNDNVNIIWCENQREYRSQIPTNELYL